MKKQVFFRRSHWATSRSLIQKKCPKSVLVSQHIWQDKSSHFSNNYLREEEETSIIAQWPSLHTRLERQKAITPNDVFSYPPCLKTWWHQLLSHFTGPDAHLVSVKSKVQARFLCNEPLIKRNLQTTLGKNTLSDCQNALFRPDCAIKAYRLNSAVSNWFFWAKTKRHSVDIQIDYRHSLTFSKFVDDVHSRNLIQVSSTHNELKYFLQLTVQLLYS